jgi:hypothetical protein
MFLDTVFLLDPFLRGIPVISLCCKVCNAEFEVRPYRANTAQFCSRRCHNLGTRDKREPARLAAIVGKPAHNSKGVRITCAWCKQLFPVPPSHADSKRYCNNKCYTNAQRAAVEHSTGVYIFIRVGGAKVLEHRYKMEKKLRRKLKRSEVVHHRDGNRSNNNLANLRLMSLKEHSAYHTRRNHNNR